VKKIVDAAPPARERAKARKVDVHTRAAEDRLKVLLGTRVRIVRRGKKGRIEIDFNSEDELIRIFEQLTER
jgi:phosphoribosylformylglycinamidine (FGAM) synthase PurS component